MDFSAKLEDGDTSATRKILCSSLSEAWTGLRMISATEHQFGMLQCLDVLLARRMCERIKSCEVSRVLMANCVSIFKETVVLVDDLLRIRGGLQETSKLQDMSDHLLKLTQYWIEDLSSGLTWEQSHLIGKKLCLNTVETLMLQTKPDQPRQYGDYLSSPCPIRNALATNSSLNLLLNVFKAHCKHPFQGYWSHKLEMKGRVRGCVAKILRDSGLYDKTRGLKYDFLHSYIAGVWIVDQGGRALIDRYHTHLDNINGV